MTIEITIIVLFAAMFLYSLIGSMVQAKFGFPAPLWPIVAIFILILLPYCVYIRMTQGMYITIKENN